MATIKLSITMDKLDKTMSIIQMLKDKANIKEEPKPEVTRDVDPRKWTEEDIKTVEDYDMFLIANGCEIAHTWDLEDWKQTDDCFIDEILAEDYMNIYAEGEDEEATIYGLNYWKLHNQLRQYIENACVSN